jgi:hypothetical protein
VMSVDDAIRQVSAGKTYIRFDELEEMVMALASADVVAPLLDPLRGNMVVGIGTAVDVLLDIRNVQMYCVDSLGSADSVEYIGEQAPTETEGMK